MNPAHGSTYSTRRNAVRPRRHARLHGIVMVGVGRGLYPTGNCNCPKGGRGETEWEFACHGSGAKIRVGSPWAVLRVSHPRHVAARGGRRPRCPALMVSDIHFEPFWDPAKVAQLVAAPPRNGAAILPSPESPDRAQRFAAPEARATPGAVDTNSRAHPASLQCAPMLLPPSSSR